MLKQSLRLFLLICTCLIIIACSKIDQRHFDKIKSGMSESDVISILGEPTSSQNIDISGLTGKSAVWKTEKVEIDIQFINEKVSVKSFSKLE